MAYRRIGGSPTTWSVAALAAGFLLGLAGRAGGGAAAGIVADVARPVAQLWLAALQMAVLPLVVALLLVAVLGAREGLGGLGGKALLLFVGLLAAAGIFSMLATPPLVGLYPVNESTAGAILTETPVPEEIRASAGAQAGGFGDWIAGLLPDNLVRAALEGDVLALLLFTVLFGLAATRLPEDLRGTVERGARALASTMLTLTHWIILFTPVGVFAFMYLVALQTGGGTAGLLGAFVAIQSGLMIVVTLLLYPLATILGRVSPGDFARAVAPAQVVAFGTRSSIASLPALIEGGRDRLGLPASATGFVLPLSVSVFKINRTVSSTVKLLFLAHVFDIPLTLPTLAAFLITVILLSFTSAGVPGGGTTFKTLPAYLAAGVPIEGVVLLEAVDAIPDIFKTVLNVTGDMTVAAILSRDARALAPAAEPLPAPGVA
jgi:Na+/H+-dicarboxylate symporter